MQTFMPHVSFDESARVLDRQRLAGQRKEAVQLLRAIEPYLEVGTPELIARKRLAFERGDVPKRGWANHAAAVMWRGRVPALLEYLKVMDREWKRRGYNSTLVIPDAGPVVMPSWMGDERVHSSHRSNLKRKLPEHYEQFNWEEPDDLPYHWPGSCTGIGGMAASSGVGEPLLGQQLRSTPGA